MSRYNPDIIVRGDDWDPDESAALKGSYGYLELQRIALAFAALKDVANTEDGAREAEGIFASLILLMYRDATLRRPETPYQPDKDRPKFDFTEEDLRQQPMGTLTYLVTTGAPHVAKFLPQLEGTADNPDPVVPITPAAQEVGLTPARFPANHANKGLVLAR